MSSMYHLKLQMQDKISDEEHVDIPTHKLIVAVRERPALYDRSHAQYNVKRMKVVLWNEIGEKLFPKQWQEWNKMEKKTSVCYMQKRWGNLRTTFARDIKKIIKRKQEGLDYDESLITWRYYNSMLFLKNFMTIQLDGAPVVFENDDTTDDDQLEKYPVKLENFQEDFEEQYLEDYSNESGDDTTQNETLPVPEFICEMSKHSSESYSEDDVTPRKIAKKHLFGETITGKNIKTTCDARKGNVSSSNGDILYSLLKGKETKKPSISMQDIKNIDHDIFFAMSLVPLLKELPAGQKLQAQIDILTIFKRYSEGVDNTV